MTSDELKTKAREMFTGNHERMMASYLDRMQGWFDITGGRITFSPAINKAASRVKYVAYLLAAYVSSYIDVRESPYVGHDEVNGYFGWSKGRTATQFASEWKELLTSDSSGAKAVLDGRLSDAIEVVEGGMK